MAPLHCGPRRSIRGRLWESEGNKTRITDTTLTAHLHAKGFGQGQAQTDGGFALCANAVNPRQGIASDGVGLRQKNLTYYLPVAAFDQVKIQSDGGFAFAARGVDSDRVAADLSCFGIEMASQPQCGARVG